jgi:hypothetical protein
LDFKLKFVVVYMINEHTTDEEFLAKFYWNIFRNPSETFEVNHTIDDHTTTEEF